MAIRFARIIEQDLKGDSKRKAVRTEVPLRKIGIFEKEQVEPKKTGEGAKAAYREFSSLADKVEVWVQNSEKINITAITPALRSVIERNLIDDLYHYLTFETGEGDAPAAHSIKVTTLSLKIGTGMGYDNDRLADLATTAFLHDVGRYKMPEDVPNKSGTLSNQEFKEIQSHPEISADILSRSEGGYRWMADVVLQVHERADGSGYPFGLKQEEIHDYAFIIGLADMYSDMISDGPDGERIEQNRAVRDIIDSAKQAFPAKVVKAFLHQISFFPLGSYVKLNDRSVGRVTDTDPGFPLKPTVEIIYDSLGGKLQKPRIVDLSQQILLYITGSIDEKDIS
jgi:HD-GYP domain-containing protein (c-di-GMP phosphodiesterase class II)